VSDDGPEREAFLRSADHAITQAREQGCCCEPVVQGLGWMPGPDGRPTPVLTITHEGWCPLLRAVEGTAPQMRHVQIEPGEDMR
jgi:hypothetical protein